MRTNQILIAGLSRIVEEPADDNQPEAADEIRRGAEQLQKAQSNQTEAENSAASGGDAGRLFQVIGDFPDNGAKQPSAIQGESRAARLNTASRVLTQAR